jgi:hypothetical protein
VIGVGVWVYKSHQRHNLANNSDDLNRFEIIKRSILSASAFALYTLSFGSHAQLLKQTLAIPDKLLKMIEGILMISFPMIMKLFGDSFDSTAAVKKF